MLKNLTIYIHNCVLQTLNNYNANGNSNGYSNRPAGTLADIMFEEVRVLVDISWSTPWSRVDMRDDHN